MRLQSTTESTRIDKELLDAIKLIIPTTGQTITGYINIHLRKQIEKDLLKMSRLHEKSNS
jgi:antitoxin component of RelBE/YafQ-DinJ toxin-antitoxin module